MLANFAGIKLQCPLLKCEYFGTMVCRSSNVLLTGLCQQLFNRSFLQNPHHSLSEDKEGSPLTGIDFMTTFQDEDKLIEGANVLNDRHQFNLIGNTDFISKDILLLLEP